MKWLLLACLVLFPLNALGQPRVIILGDKEPEQEAVWVRDPFAAPGEAGEITEGEEITALFRISAIIYSDKRSSAVINGQRVDVGDLLSGMQVVEIRKNAVVLKPYNRGGLEGDKRGRGDD